LNGRWTFHQSLQHYRIQKSLDSEKKNLYETWDFKHDCMNFIVKFLLVLDRATQNCPVDGSAYWSKLWTWNGRSLWQCDSMLSRKVWKATEQIRASWLFWWQSKVWHSAKCIRNDTAEYCKGTWGNFHYRQLEHCVRIYKSYISVLSRTWISYIWTVILYLTMYGPLQSKKIRKSSEIQLRQLQNTFRIQQSFHWLEIMNHIRLICKNTPRLE
jgi:hypothetical protein